MPSGDASEMFGLGPSRDGPGPFVFVPNLSAFRRRCNRTSLILSNDLLETARIGTNPKDRLDSGRGPRGRAVPSTGKPGGGAQRYTAHGLQPRRTWAASTDAGNVHVLPVAPMQDRPDSVGDSTHFGPKSRPIFLGPIRRAYRLWYVRSKTLPLIESHVNGRVPVVKDNIGPGVVYHDRCPSLHAPEGVERSGFVLYRVEKCPGQIRKVSSLNGRFLHESTRFFEFGASIQKAPTWHRATGEKAMHTPGQECADGIPARAGRRRPYERTRLVERRTCRREGSAPFGVRPVPPSACP
jgi:hypothetical protein